MQKYSASKKEEIPLSTLIKHTAASTMCITPLFLVFFLYIRIGLSFTIYVTGEFPLCVTIQLILYNIVSVSSSVK